MSEETKYELLSLAIPVGFILLIPLCRLVS